MDTFLREINAAIYMKWVSMHEHEEIDITQVKKLSYGTKMAYRFESDYGYATVALYDQEIITLNVYNFIDEDPQFFLHFQMNSMGHAVELFNEMFKTLLELKLSSKKRLLLCCTGGLTTSYFASKIQEAIDVLEMQYEVGATSYVNLFDQAVNYDVILLAPQIHYQYSKLKMIYKDKIIIEIPPKVFASYDVKSVIKLVDNYNDVVKKSETVILNKNSIKHLKSTVLCISLYRNISKVHIRYRIYDSHKRLLLKNEIIKNSILLTDIYDVIDTSLLNYPDIEVIGFSAPGIINEGKATTANVNGFNAMDYLGYFQRKYDKEFIIVNDVNVAAVGYHEIHKYPSFALMFQPVGTHGGCGVFINDQLIEGRYSVAGELQYLPGSGEIFKIDKTPENLAKVVAHSIQSFVVTVGIEAIVIYCTLLTDVNEVKKELLKEIPEVYHPKLELINDLEEYVFLGLLKLSEQK